ncbi:NDR1/HIN1-like 1 [Striga hermonthica]|uniref:NDR1/HIN1-like 1 n=1 Tax=Striga hermonthica TaxID=68872 RepID=A0A9N7P168_STRHE|nr:NDR1/HIN1-like 1 [Striga hermonthica]
MTAKDCGHHDRRRHRHRILAGVLTLTATALAVLLAWVILRPSKPHFVLLDIALRVFNLSASSDLLTASLQVTLSARNPNGRVRIYYDRVDAYAAYRSQQVTVVVRLPRSYQGHGDTTLWSPLLADMPLAPYLAAELRRDEAAALDVRVDGRLRWKVGAFVSGRYHLHVNCPVNINFQIGNKNFDQNNNDKKNSSNGVVVGSGKKKKYQLIMDCHVDV